MNEVLTLSISAFGLGVLHALEPGHGKTFMLGVLLNARRRWTDPFFLACWTALGHMLGVLLFASASFLLAHEFIEGQARLMFETLIGMAVTAVGLFLLARAASSRATHSKACSCCRGGASPLPERSEKRTAHPLGLIGILVGLVPCPSALALAASTASLDSFPQALSVAVTFGLGVAVCLLLLGVSITLSAHRLKHLSGLDRFANYARFAGPLSLIVVGIMIVLHAGGHSH